VVAGIRFAAQNISVLASTQTFAALSAGVRSGPIPAVAQIMQTGASTPQSPANRFAHIIGVATAEQRGNQPVLLDLCGAAELVAQNGSSAGISCLIS